MDEAQIKCILLIARTHKNMCISIDTFTDFLKDEVWNIIEPITEREILTIGLYAHLCGCKVWVSKRIPANHISFSDLEITSNKNTEQWSPILPINDTAEYKRMMRLKAFW